MFSAVGLILLLPFQVLGNPIVIDFYEFNPLRIPLLIFESLVIVFLLKKRIKTGSQTIFSIILALNLFSYNFVFLPVTRAVDEHLSKDLFQNGVGIHPVWVTMVPAHVMGETTIFVLEAFILFAILKSAISSRYIENKLNFQEVINAVFFGNLASVLVSIFFLGVGLLIEFKR